MAEAAAVGDALRRHRPAKLRAQLADGETRDVSIAGAKRSQWQRVLKVLDALDWVKLELLDKSGAVLHVVAGAADDEEPTFAAAPAPASMLGFVQAIASIITGACDAAVLRHNQALMPLLQTNAQLLRDVSAELSIVNREKRALADRLTELASVSVRTDDEGESQLASSAVLLQMAPHLINALKAPATPPANGHTNAKKGT